MFESAILCVFGLRCVCCVYYGWGSVPARLTSAGRRRIQVGIDDRPGIDTSGSGPKSTHPAVTPDYYSRPYSTPFDAEDMDVMVVQELL